jgi:hypothetical protein
MNGVVRSLLHPLAELAAKRNVAVVAVTHLRQADGTVVRRSMGSMAFVAAARTAWLVIRDPHNAPPAIIAREEQPDCRHTRSD